MNKNILVTGAGGFVGSHLVERLIESGCNVKALVRYNSRNEWGYIDQLPPHTRDSIDVIPGDLRDPDTLRMAVKGSDIVFHLAALISIPYSYLHPREVIETNVIGTLNVMTAARERGVERVVHTSTSEVYGTAKYVPINEEHPLQAQSPYSASKIGADKIAESFYCAYDLPVVIARPFNIYGPRQSARAVIPTIITQALSGEKVFLGSLQPTRDFTYVDDVVNAFIKIAGAPQPVGETVNIGANFEISIGDLASKITSLMGKNAEVVTDEARIRPARSEVERLWCDNTKARKLLGWEPGTSLDAGLKQTIEWISGNIDLYKTGLYNI